MIHNKNQSKPVCDSENFSLFMKSLQLVSIKQERGSFEAKVANPEENTSVNINTDASWEKRESGFDGIIEVKVELVKLERILGEISGLFRLTYNWDCEYEAYPEEFVTRFLEQNIHFNAWPYMREFVQGCFQRMGWSPVVIPLLKQRVVMVK